MLPDLILFVIIGRGLNFPEIFGLDRPELKFGLDFPERLFGKFVFVLQTSQVNDVGL